jgi:hypothetical protein
MEMDWNYYTNENTDDDTSSVGNFDDVNDIEDLLQDKALYVPKSSPINIPLPPVVEPSIVELSMMSTLNSNISSVIPSAPPSDYDIGNNYSSAGQNYAPTRHELRTSNLAKLEQQKKEDETQLEIKKKLFQFQYNQNNQNNILPSDNPDDYYVYDDILIGNGNKYKVLRSSVSSTEQVLMQYPYIRNMIQIFIELRNSLGYDSILPHKLSMNDLRIGLDILQQDHVEKYKFRFGYSYNIFRVQDTKGVRPKPYNELRAERIKHTGTNPFNANVNPDTNTNPIISFPSPPQQPQEIKTNNPFNNYVPLPQRLSRNKQTNIINSTEFRQMLDSSDSDNDIVVNNRPKIYGNKQVKRRKRPRRQPTIDDPLY